MKLRATVVGCGSYLPEHVVTNAELSQRLDTSDAWVRQRTGIAERRIAAPGELTSDLATRAAQRALEQAGMSGREVDLIVLATATPDETFPATAVKVQARLGMRGGAAFDVQAVCSGFVFALAVADNALRLGQGRTALVIGAETFSRILDWNDRSTCVLFGDGAGALLLTAVPSGTGGPEERGVLSTHLHSDGRMHDILYVDGGPSSTGTTGYLRMEGREVFRQAVAHLGEVVQEALAANGISASDIDWLVPHQANMRIIDAVGKRLGLPAGRTIVTIERHANTSAASIPLALDEAVADGRIRRGDLVLMEALGGGLTWGAALVRW
jgi:3-oxoacyl-[acyl-carrier-protein] synthase-3